MDWTLPNVLTLGRILLVPVLVAALLAEAPDWVAAGVFAFASFTDALDGWIARRDGTVTTFGKLMDPLADKLLVAAALVALVDLGRLGAWVTMLIISREFAVTGLRQLHAERRIALGANRAGKAKTTCQVVMVLALILVEGEHWWLDVLVYGTVAITLWSGATYFRGFRDADPDRSSGDPVTKSSFA